jgi:hypothetical protein
VSKIAFAAGFGTAVAMLLLLAIIVDEAFLAAGHPTISERTLTAAIRYPAIAALIGAVLGLVIGILLGHLFVPQYVTPPR